MSRRDGANKKRGEQQETRTADGVDFIHENDAGRVLAAEGAHRPRQHVNLG